MIIFLVVILRAITVSCPITISKSAGGPYSPVSVTRGVQLLTSPYVKLIWGICMIRLAVTKLSCSISWWNTCKLTRMTEPEASSLLVQVWETFRQLNMFCTDKADARIVVEYDLAAFMVRQGALMYLWILRSILTASCIFFVFVCRARLLLNYALVWHPFRHRSWLCYPSTILAAARSNICGAWQDYPHQIYIFVFNDHCHFSCSKRYMAVFKVLSIDFF